MSSKEDSTAEETVSLFTHLQCEPPTLRINQNFCPPAKNTQSHNYSSQQITSTQVWVLSPNMIIGPFGHVLDNVNIVPRLPSTTPREITSEMEFGQIFIETVYPLVRRGLFRGFEVLKEKNLLESKGRTEG